MHLVTKVKGMGYILVMFILSTVPIISVLFYFYVIEVKY